MIRYGKIDMRYACASTHNFTHMYCKTYGMATADTRLLAHSIREFEIPTSWRNCFESNLATDSLFAISITRYYKIVYVV